MTVYNRHTGVFTPLSDVLSSKQKKAEYDSVTNPQHYCTGKYECIDVMLEVFGVETIKNFCTCNAFKYIYRANRKNGSEDYKKAIWYLNKYIELSEPCQSMKV